MIRRLLILGGTAEARALADHLLGAGADTGPDTESADTGIRAGPAPLEVISSLAGRVAGPQRPRGSVRIGGFGGPEGLASYLRTEQISAVVDATHPFAAQITAHAASACSATGTPLLVLRRPGWEPVDGDRWTSIPSLAAGAGVVTGLVGPGGRVLLTIGRQDAHVFACLPQRFWLRALEAPDPPLPRHCELILARGPFTLDGERKLLRELEIDLLVTKNSGGPMTAAKLTAARELGLPVLIADRPALPEGVARASSVADAAIWASEPS